MKVFIILLFLISPISHSAIKDTFKEIGKDIRNNKCQDALIKLFQIRTKKSKVIKRLYFEGLCHSRLKNFSKAISKFKEIGIRGSKFKDYHYEYGQALYANNDLEDSRKSFTQSVNSKYKKHTSLYYVAHISQLLEEFKPARENYLRVIKDKTSKSSLKQVARFQLGEVFLGYAESKYKGKELKKVIRDHSLAQMDFAYKQNPKSGIAPQIKKRIREIKRRYELAPNILRNGKELPEKRWNVDLSQDLRYDSNVTLASSLPTVTVVNNDSFIYESEIRGKYRFIIDRQFVIYPQVNLNWVNHANSDNSDVYQNDSFDYSPGFESSVEHNIGKLKAAFLFDYEYKYSKTDRNGEKKLVFNSKQSTFTLGEKFTYFKNGPSTFKFKYKTLTSYDENYDSTTLSFFFNQIWMTKEKHILLGTFSGDLTSVEQSSNSTNSFLFRADYIAPVILKHYTFNPNFSLTLLDPKEQSSTRGLEKTIKPSVKITRKFFKKKLSTTIGYDFTKKFSRDETNFAYKKHEFYLTLKYSF